MVGRGLFLCHKVLTRDPQFFDYKPLIMKQWEPDMDLHKENVKTIPIWIRLPNLELKYWGSTCLHKLGDSIGTTLKVDHITLNKERLTYARLLVEVGLEEELPDHIWFVNEKGVQMKQAVEYELRPTLCTNCKRYGHPVDKCNKQKGAPKPVWKPKPGIP
ncbi:hypothetical protein RDABS01_002478 [Bienertia sinuspersici]